MQEESKNIFRIYSKCIFCRNELASPKERIGSGEHVFPKAVFGFWRSYDICSECRQYFGDNVDHLAAQNPLIIDSLKMLNLGKPEKHYEQLPYFGKDVNTDRPVNMIRRNGTYKVKTTIDENYLECSEKDFDNIALYYCKKIGEPLLEPLELENKLSQLKKSFFNLKIGESFKDSLFGEIKRSQISNVEYDHEKLPLISPLIAKIVFTAIHYFIHAKYLNHFQLYDAFRDHARFNSVLPEYTINSCILNRSTIRYPFHRIGFLPTGHTLLIDVMFFGYVNWRSVLPFSEPIELDDGVEPVEKFSFYLDFSDPTNRKKILAFNYPDGRYIEREIEG